MIDRRAVTDDRQRERGERMAGPPPRPLQAVPGEMRLGPWFVIALAVATCLQVGPERVLAQSTGAGRLRQVGFDQHLDAQVPVDLPFRDEMGRTVTLAQYLGKKPVILTLVYYNCPMLCTIELNGLVRSLKVVTPSVGRDFEIITVSIHPDETPALASAKKEAYLKRYGRAGAAAGWHFLTGEEPSIRRLAQAMGFRYVYDPKSNQYAHPAGITMLTPRGRIARYLFGIEYPARDLQFGLIDSSSGKIGSPIERLLLICYHYDPATGVYTFAIMNLLRVLGSATVLALATFMLVMFRRDWRTGRALVSGDEAGSPTLDMRE